MATLNRIKAKFPGRCASSGADFTAGAEILHDPVTRRCYLPAHAPAGAVIVVPLEGSKTRSYREGWDAGAPGAPFAACPYPDKSAEQRLWAEGLRDRARSGT